MGLSLIIFGKFTLLLAVKNAHNWLILNDFDLGAI